MTEKNDACLETPDRDELSAAKTEEEEEKPEKKERRGGSGSSRALKEKLAQAEEEVERLTAELKDLNDRHLRRLAEIENLRKRHDKERVEYTQFALSDFIFELLGILDNIERALESAKSEDDGSSFREGVEMIYRMTHQILAKKGVRPVVISDGRFDPEFHHAMSMEESDHVEEPVVGQELQKGYLLHDRLLRPALVKVLVPRKG